MWRKFLFGFLWWIVLCSLVLFIGSIALTFVLPHDAAGHVTNDGALVAERIGSKMGLPLCLFLACLVFIASRRGWLPGTNTKRPAA
jgi:hypothetical protein